MSEQWFIHKRSLSRLEGGINNLQLLGQLCLSRGRAFGYNAPGLAYLTPQLLQSPQLFLNGSSLVTEQQRINYFTRCMHKEL